MKTLLLIFMFTFLGKEPIESKKEFIAEFKIVKSQSRLRPTTDQKFQLYKSKITVANYEIKEGITEVKFQLNND